jgi:hypothetical protein
MIVYLYIDKNVKKFKWYIKRKIRYLSGGVLHIE